MSGNEHLIVSMRGKVGVVQAAFYHMLPNDARCHVTILASCPDERKAHWVVSHLPPYYDVGDVIRMEVPRERN